MAKLVLHDIGVLVDPTSEYFTLKPVFPTKKRAFNTTIWTCKALDRKKMTKWKVRRLDN